WYIVFPMLKPITATIAILNTLWIWNDFLLPSLVLFLNDRTLPLSTYSFFGQYTSNYGLAMAGLVLSITPIILFYLIMQRNVISGITEGAVK
ncbi:MAG: carbohydrate ABC transporter permease, partial [Chloroflexi bacterium]|nr:carbohydrate ABC transporter permease [Chloroflexota bacterium]